MAAEIRQWLEELGLGKYADVFAENGVDLRSVPFLTEEDLRELGVLLGHRRILFAAIASLQNEGHTQQTGDPSLGPPTRREAERRQLTVMFSDLVGSTELSRKLDPEELREVMRAYQDAVAGCVARYGGHLAKFLGDGVLAFFGWPQAHEDQAERAVRAGLDAIAALRRLELDHLEALEARVGIATGQVVVGRLLGQVAGDTEAVSGETPNLASRLQGAASPGEVVIEITTRRLIGQVFELAELEPQRLKGFPEAVRAWRIVGEGAAADRFEAAHVDAPIKLTGRSHELALLLEQWELAKRGEGQVVLLSGEAGIGKSRMLRALDEQIAESRPFRLRYQCSEHRSNSAYFPIVQRLERTIGLTSDDTPEIKLDKLEAFLRRVGSSIDDEAPVFAALLSVSSTHRYGDLDATPQELRNRTNAALVKQVVGLSRQRPVLFALEDAHWIDPTTEMLIGELMAEIRDAAVFMVVTHRPDYVPPWTRHTHLTSIALNRLSRDQSVEIVTTIADRSLAEEIVHGIVARADGVPLYIEELTRFILDEAGTHDDESIETQIPASLQASLVARLDRLGDAKKIAQMGSVIGRVFRHELIAAAAEWPVEKLDDALGQIVASELLFKRGDGQDAVYTFKHALVRDTAYQTLLRSTRQQFHQRIARAIDERFPAIVENEPEVVAHHYSEAGLLGEAAVYWERSGRRALEFFAYHEAIEHLERALASLLTLPPDLERDDRELGLQLALGAAWIAAKAYSAEEVRRAYGAAVDLAGRVGTADQRFVALRGLWNNHLMRVELNEAKQLAAQLQEVAQSSGNAERQLVAERAAGSGLMALGEHQDANTCFHRGIELYAPESHQRYIQRYGEDPGLWCYGYAAWTDDWLGYRDRALDEIIAEVELARELSEPHTLTIALTNAATLYVFRRDLKTALRMSEEAMQVSDELGNPQHYAWGSIHKGWVLAHQGKVDEGHAAIEAGLTMWRTIGGVNNRTHFLNLLADVCRLAGKPAAGMVALDEAEEIAASVDLHAHEAETFRQRGQLYLALGQEAEAEASWRRAIEAAKTQGTKTFELRAAINLASFQVYQRNQDRAREFLAPILTWFEEGHDTADLRDAKSLLDNLV